MGMQSLEVQLRIPFGCEPATGLKWTAKLLTQVDRYTYIYIYIYILSQKWVLSVTFPIRYVHLYKTSFWFHGMVQYLEVTTRLWMWSRTLRYHCLHRMSIRIASFLAMHICNTNKHEKSQVLHRINDSYSKVAASNSQDTVARRARTLRVHFACCLYLGVWGRLHSVWDKHVLHFCVGIFALRVELVSSLVWPLCTDSEQLVSCKACVFWYSQVLYLVWDLVHSISHIWINGQNKKKL